jgi:putative ABC transport system permease protein
MLLQDIHYGIRMLLKQPGFTAIAVITLALGIGVNTSIFSVVNAVLLTPLPYEESERLMALWESQPKNNLKQQPVSLPNFNDWREQSQSFEQIAAYRNFAFTLTGDGEPERINGARVSTNFFELLKLKPVAGRSFMESDGRASAEPVVMISSGFWNRRYGADSDLPGRTLILDGKAYTIVGVLPPLKIPSADTDIWTPLIAQPHEQVRGFRFMRVLGRLKQGISPEQAREEMEIIANRLEQKDPQYNANWRIDAIPLHEQTTGGARPVLLVLLGAVGSVLLIACANVANLLLARSASRQMEMAIRSALGASRRHLVRQLLTESLLLSLLGGGLGLLIAFLAVSMLSGINSIEIPRADEIRIDTRVLGFTLLVSLITGFLFGIAPAARASDMKLAERLKDGGRGSAGGVRHRRLLNLVVISEIALALMLLAGSGLLIRSFIVISNVALGLNPDNLLTMSISLPASRYKEQQKQVDLYNNLIARISSMPGIRSAAGVSKIPITGFATANFTIHGRPVPFGSEPIADYRTVTTQYFRTMGVSLLKGREFTEQDKEDSPDVVVINETMAKNFWPGEDPIGKRVQIATERTRWREIVGVVGDVRHTNLEDKIGSAIYVPFPQNSWANALSASFLAVRTDGDNGSAVAGIRNELRSIDKNLAISQVRTMEGIVSESLSHRRFGMLLLAIFAAIASLLAVVGVYGVIAYSVAERTHEFGIRMALGAQKLDLIKMVLSDGAKLILIGIAAGLVTAFLTARLISSLLFGVSSGDPVTFITISLLLALSALLASYIPARRAARVDPIIALQK